jgi:hypothetical protein
LRVTIRKLSYLQVKNAQSARLTEVMARSREAAEFRDLLTGINPEVIEEARAKAQDDPAQSYDVQMTLHAGIVAWSYPEPLSTANIDDLLAPGPADFIFREIIAFTERSPDEKKGSAPSSEVISAPAAAEDGP